MAMPKFPEPSFEGPPNEPKRAGECAERETARAAPETSSDRRHRLLTAARLGASIRKVARSHEVPDDAVEDIVQETLARAWKAKLPASDDEVGKYVNGIAVNVSCSHMRKAAKEPEPYVENADDEKGEVASTVGAPPPSFEARDAVSRLVDEGEERFPREFASYLEAKATDATAEEIARRRGVSPGHVRREWVTITRFVHEHAKALGLIAVAGLLLLIIGNMANWGHDDYVAHPRPTPDAASLRVRAKDDCAQSRWQTCADELDEANEVDPGGETPELRDLRALAKQKIESLPPTQ